MITLTAGGNNVGFSNIINRCVYGFTDFLPFQQTCDQALSASEELIDNHDNLWNSLFGTINSILSNPKVQENPNVRIMVTSMFSFLAALNCPHTDDCAADYPKFWNAATNQCDTATFNVWETQGTDVSRMSKDLRNRMNELSTKMNAIILDVVQNLAGQSQNRVHYVDIDRYFEGHRFCEDEYDEPWAYINNEPNGRPNQWIYQLGTPLGNLRNEDTSEFASRDVIAYAQGFQETLRAQNATLKSEYGTFGELMGAQEDLTSGGLPLAMSKLFHPTSNGHQAIAQAISDSLDQLVREHPTPGDILKGPTTFHQTLSPGGGGNDLEIPEGCFVTVPVDNTIPKIFQSANPTTECGA